jgi:uncharacterized protein
MPVQVSYPGVYVQEVPSGARTITGVSTSIAAFVGMSSRGPKNLPTRVLGFLEYTRVFGDLTSQGEMSDQVRQFFTNGGQQAFVVRIGDDNLLEATATLVGINNTTNLILKAISAGEDGNELRVSVDYSTDSSERTFNLTVFREVLDASGNPTRPTTETFRNLSMNPADARYVLNALKASALVTGTVTGNDLSTSATVDQGSSITGLLSPDILASFTAAIPTTGAAQGKFRISVGGAPFRTVAFTRPGTGSITAAAIQTAIELQAGLTTGSLAVTVVEEAETTPDQFLRITSTNHMDVVIEPAADSDIAVPLSLGAAQGGIELGAFQAHRPKASGLVSELGTDLEFLLAFGRSTKAGWAGGTPPHLVITGAVPLDITGTAVTFPPGPTMKQVTATTTDPHLLANIRTNLGAIADAINNDPRAGWKAQVPSRGFRLVLTPDEGAGFGLASLISGASFAAGGPVGFADAGSIFGGITSRPTGASLENGQNGGLPALKHYNAAFTVIDQQVDLFNLLVLPRSAGDTSLTRTTIWGPASSFCLNRRAFLLVDPIPDDSLVEPTVQQALKDIVTLRIGVVKDYAAAYWPRIKINPDGNTRFIDPSGSIAGIMARIDTSRGVWKAPAGLEADLRGVLGVRAPMTDLENGLLNPQAFNAIRQFPNGIVAWGARTMNGFDESGDVDFKYVPVRRFQLFIEESLVRGLKFAVFEPNAEPLWGQIRVAVGGFMNNLFRQGAFAGNTARDSYFVKADAETTTQNDINLGIVNVLVGFAPLKPAEFVIITIKQMAGQIQV